MKNFNSPLTDIEQLYYQTVSDTVKDIENRITRIASSEGECDLSESINKILEDSEQLRKKSNDFVAGTSGIEDVATAAEELAARCIIYSSGVMARRRRMDGKPLPFPEEPLIEKATPSKLSALTSEQAFSYGVYNLWKGLKENPTDWKNQFYYLTEVEKAIKQNISLE